MPFDVLETETRENMPAMASLSYLRNVRKGNEQNRGNVKPKLIAMLPTAVVISRKKRFLILVGHGADSGKIRFVGTDEPKKGAKATDFKSYIKLYFGHVPALGDDIFDGEKYPITKIDDDTYEVEVKELFKEAAVAVLNKKRKLTAA